MTENVTIGAIERNNREEVRVSLEVFSGHRFLNVRTYADTKLGAVTARAPTKKGVVVGLDQIDDLIGLLNAAKAKLPEWAGEGQP